MNNQYGVNRKFARRKRNNVSRILIGIVVFSLLGIASCIGFRDKPKAAPLPAVHTLNLRQQQTLDVTIVGGAIGQYVAANGSLPTRLSTVSGAIIMCGNTCDAINSQINQLGSYKPSGVQIKPYVVGLTVPNSATMYLIASATCKDKNGLGEVSTQANAMVILYATETDSSTAQHCIKL